MISKQELRHHFYGGDLNSYSDFRRSTNAKPEAAKLIAPRLKACFLNRKKNLSILDVGCGDGELISNLLNRLLSHRPDLQIDLTAIDPEHDVLNLCKKKLQGFPSNVETAFKQVGVEPQPAPSLIESLKGQQFDFVLASFVMFWIDDWEYALDQFLKCLKPGGLLCIILLSREHNKECAEFRSRVYEIAHSKTGLRMEFAEDMEEILRKRNIKYDEEIGEYDVELGPEPWREINGTMEFIIRFPRNGLSEEQANAIKEHTRAMIKSPVLTCCQKALWIKKNE